MFESFFSQKPSIQVLETLEACTLLELSYDDYQALLKAYPVFFYKLTAQATVERYINMHRLFSSFVLQTPKQRYENFVKEYSSLANRIPQKYFASFIGVDEKSVPRIKKRIKENDKSK